jgi:hypothetical protein
MGQATRACKRAGPGPYGSVRMCLFPVGGIPAACRQRPAGDVLRVRTE